MLQAQDPRYFLGGGGSSGIVSHRAHAGIACGSSRARNSGKTTFNASQVFESSWGRPASSCRITPSRIADVHGLLVGMGVNQAYNIGLESTEQSFTPDLNALIRRHSKKKAPGASATRTTRLQAVTGTKLAS